MKIDWNNFFHELENQNHKHKKNKFNYIQIDNSNHKNKDENERFQLDFINVKTDDKIKNSFIGKINIYYLKRNFIPQFQIFIP